MFVSGYCQGEKCYCGDPASHKVEEVIFHDDPLPGRHPLTAYVCDVHFRRLMGPLKVPKYTQVLFGIFVGLWIGYLLGAL